MLIWRINFKKYYFNILLNKKHIKNPYTHLYSELAEFLPHNNDPQGERRTGQYKSGGGSFVVNSAMAPNSTILTKTIKREEKVIFIANSGPSDKFPSTALQKFYERSFPLSAAGFLRMIQSKAKRKAWPDLGIAMEFELPAGEQVPGTLVDGWKRSECWTWNSDKWSIICFLGIFSVF